jgi:uncharacterized protein YxjI
MRYLMKQKLFALGDDFVIRNENGDDAFFVDGKLFSLGKQLSFQDMQGNELAFIKQKLLSLGTTYEIYRGDRHYARVHKELFTFFKCSFTVDVEGPGDLEAQGNLTDHEYEFTRDGAVVAVVSKRWFSFADTYGVDITADVDPVLILASTVVIDMACHEKSGFHSGLGG